ncbi:sensor histidine kinase [Brevundimonas sp. Root1423]|uniref:sensor histidine kinase n=1 Tax=Brevundimonas sp. Root1423 TaxID=1736462 RepID=UPI0006FBC326|nr:HWE histidine kinase domain-containing protein [Brevundimonas sp. Root1423]KQY91736.1 histidine kinase [Brevundimonas sp. Root1423]
MKQLAESGGLVVDLADAFDASPNPYVLLTPDLRIAGANKAYLEVTRTAREAIIGRPLFAAFDSGPGDDAPENVRQVKASLEKARDTRQRDHLAMVRFSMPGKSDGPTPVFEERVWSATHTPILNAAGEVIWLLQHTTDITELEQLRQGTRHRKASARTLDAIVGGGVLARAREVQEDNRRLAEERNRLQDMFMQSPGFVAVLAGPDHVFEFYNDAYRRLIGDREIQGLPTAEALPEVVGQGYIDMLDSVFETGEPVQGQASLVQLQRAAGETPQDAYVDFFYQPIRDPDGTIIGVFVQGHDVTEGVRAAERQKLMIDELNHRVKNTLATVQSIAMQTARSHTDPKTFAEGFQARLLALSHTHDLLTRSHWEGADLAAVLEHETEAHGAHRVTLNGLPVALGPASALSLGMIFHELATNAAKYGALSAPEGRVLVDWSVSNQARPVLHLSWREMGGPPVLEPARRGFGSRLIERNVRHDLAGEVKLDYASEGFSADFSIPLDRGTNS